MSSLTQLHGLAAANDDDGRVTRDRTTPIGGSITEVPGYPRKLVVFKIRASRYWQMRCWLDGRNWRRSAQTTSLTLAQARARLFYESLLAQRARALWAHEQVDEQGYGRVNEWAYERAGDRAGEHAYGQAGQQRNQHIEGPIERHIDHLAKEHFDGQIAHAEAPRLPRQANGIDRMPWLAGRDTTARRGRREPSLSFAAAAETLWRSESARVKRGEYSRGSLQVLRNRLDGHILEHFGPLSLQEVTYGRLQAFAEFLSQRYTTITISQYLVAVRKVLAIAHRAGFLEALPEFPKVKIVNQPRSAFTPSEYWRVMRSARALVGLQHPLPLRQLRLRHKVRHGDSRMPQDLPWAVGFMVNAFLRPSDLRTLRHRHVEVVHSGSRVYLRLTLPETKRHAAPIVTLAPAVRIYEQIVRAREATGQADPDDYLFLPHLKDRGYALAVLGVMFNWALDVTGLKLGPHGTPRSLYSLRHSAITFRLLYGSGIDLVTLARNARTSIEVINEHYASTVTGEQNIALLQSRRSVVVKPRAG